MRSKSWATNLDREATIEEYVKAIKTGAYELADRIELANSGDNLTKGWEPIPFENLANENRGKSA